MTPADGGATVFRFSTDHLPPHDRAAAVREMHERCPLPFKPEPMEPLSDRLARVDISQWALPGLGIMSGTLGGLCQHIKPERSAPTGIDDVFLSVAGARIVSRANDQIVVHEGDAFLAIRGARGFIVAHPTAVRFVGLRLPRTALAPLVPDLDHSEVRVIPHGTAALKLLRRYIHLIAQETSLATPQLQRVAVTHVYDLTAVTIGTSVDQAKLAESRGLRAARLQVVKADIMAHLEDGNLTIAAVAARHRMSLRYLQKLFETDGTSFSEFLVDQRLASAYRMLTNRLRSNRPISDIAYAIGFNDLSYFNRAFRRRYGATPSDVRRGRQD